MSSARLLARLLVNAIPLARSRTVRCFSASPAALFPRRIPSPKDMLKAADATVPRTTAYSAADLAELAQHFSPSQLSALLAGEKAIDPADLRNAFLRREGDSHALTYVDDLTQIDPILDFPTSEMTSEVKIVEDPEDGEKYQIRQPDIPLIEDPNLSWPTKEAEEGELKLTLKNRLGASMSLIDSSYAKTLVVHRVVNQTRMGKIQKTYTLAVAGNGKGLLGIGEGKSSEPEDSQRIALHMAVRNMVPVARYERRTIHGDVKIKNGAVEMEICARPPGFGVRCSHHIFEMCRLAGIHDLSARVTRSRNPMNVIKTFMMALQKQKLPETIARGRGKKFVDVRKVYYGGLS